MSSTTLDDLQTHQRRTRALIHPTWFPLVLFGSLTVGSIAFMAAAGEENLGWYWGFAGPLGGLAIAAWSIRRERMLGVRTNDWAQIFIGIGLMIGCFASGSGALGAGSIQAAGPTVAIAVGYLCFAAVTRSKVVLLAGSTLAMIGLVGLITKMDEQIVFAALDGGVLLASGVMARLSQR